MIYGDIAQLAEHLLCKQEVVGSTPAISTYVSVKQKEKKAGVAQLVERSPSKSKVTGSSPVTRYIQKWPLYRY